jgi:hypothetical protein
VGEEAVVRVRSQAATPPSRQPRPTSVVARSGSRFSFEAVPCAVCFAVDLTALRAKAFLIDDMALGYPFEPAA